MVMMVRAMMVKNTIGKQWLMMVNHGQEWIGMDRNGQEWQNDDDDGDGDGDDEEQEEEEEEEKDDDHGMMIVSTYTGEYDV